ncbi:hypothetical protein [Gordonia sp. NPDC003422]
MSYTDTMAALADSTDARVQALYARHERGEITEEQFVALATAVVSQGESRAVSLADVALAATLTAATSALRVPVGMLPTVNDASTSVAEVIREALADPDPPVKLTINVRDRVLDTAQRSYGTAMRRQGVRHWTRRLNSGACELCRDLAGDVLPTEADMYRHKGCGCSQKPITEEKTPA